MTPDWFAGFLSGVTVMSAVLVVYDHLIVPWFSRRTVHIRSPHERR